MKTSASIITFLCLFFTTHLSIAQPNVYEVAEISTKLKDGTEMTGCIIWIANIEIDGIILWKYFSKTQNKVVTIRQQIDNLMPDKPYWVCANPDDGEGNPVSDYRSDFFMLIPGNEKTSICMIDTDMFEANKNQGQKFTLDEMILGEINYNTIAFTGDDGLNDSMITAACKLTASYGYPIDQGMFMLFAK